MTYKKIISIMLFTLSLLNAIGQFKYSPSKIDSTNSKLKFSDRRTNSSVNGSFKNGMAISFENDMTLKLASENDSNVKLIIVEAEKFRKKSLKNFRNFLIATGASIIAINNEEKLYINDFNYLGAATSIIALHQYIAAIINAEKARHSYDKARKMAGISTIPILNKRKRKS